MIYRIVACLLLVAVLLALAALSEGDSRPAPVPTSSGASDDPAMKNFKIN